jgi:hypothetical protein
MLVLFVGELKLGYLKKAYFVTMQTPLMAIMLEYEHKDVVSIDELLEATKLKFDSLRKHLMPLIESQLLIVEGDIKSMSFELISLFEFVIVAVLYWRHNLRWVLAGF